jgi:hypothetical protein
MDHGRTRDGIDTKLSGYLPRLVHPFVLIQRSYEVLRGVNRWLVARTAHKQDDRIHRNQNACNNSAHGVASL